MTKHLASAMTEVKGYVMYELYDFRWVDTDEDSETDNEIVESDGDEK